MRIGIFNHLIKFQTVPLLTSLVVSMGNDTAIDLFTVDDSIINMSNLRVFNFSKIIWNSLSPFVLLLKSLRFIMNEKYDYVAAVDPHDIIPAIVLKKIFKAKLIYICLEIFVKKDINNNYYRYYYYLQHALMRYFDYIIITDQGRQMLLSENAPTFQNKTKWICLPNSTMGDGQLFRSQFLHQRLNICINKKILLLPGDITNESMIHALCAEARKIDDTYVIVLHSRSKQKQEQLLRVIGEHKGIRVSIEPVPYDKLDQIYGSAHIGLVIYDVTQKGMMASNVQCIGKSSGKLNNFLKLGVPVIMTDLPFFRELERKYDCGVCVNNIDEIIRATELIERQYVTYSKNAETCFAEEMSFGKAFQEAGHLFTH